MKHRALLGGPLQTKSTLNITNTGGKMNLWKNMRPVFTAFAVGAIVLATVTSSVEAKDKKGTGKDCPQGWFCLYEGKGWQGRMLKFRDGDDLSPWGFRDKASSWINNTKFTVTLTEAVLLQPFPSVPVTV